MSLCTNLFTSFRYMISPMLISLSLLFQCISLSAYQDTSTILMTSSNAYLSIFVKVIMISSNAYLSIFVKVIMISSNAYLSLFCKSYYDELQRLSMYVLIQASICILLKIFKM